MSDAHPFYGKEILRNREHAKINSLLEKFKGRSADAALKKEIYETLQKAKEEGVISIPFKIALRKSPSPYTPSYIEVILDTKL